MFKLAPPCKPNSERCLWPNGKVTWESQAKNPSLCTAAEWLCVFRQVIVLPSSSVLSSVERGGCS